VPADGGLAGPHGTDQEDVVLRFGHEGMVAENRRQDNGRVSGGS
jgi:hypothetical protein